MKLSIIVPVYNMAADGKLDYCLQSLIHQEMEDYEIIAVDDCSTDDSLKILQDYEERYPEVFRVLHHDQNKKQGGAKNTGLTYAAGEWIGFIDADDWISPDFYKKLIEKGEESGADVVGCHYSLVTEHTMTPGKVICNNEASQCGPASTETRRKLAMRPGSMVIKVYRRELIYGNHLSFPENIFYEDNCAGTVWMLSARHFELVEEPLYYYYQNPASTVHVINTTKCENRMAAARMLLSECEKRGFLKEYPQEIEFRFTELFYATTLFSYLSGIKGETFTEQLFFIRSLRDEMLRTFPHFRENAYYQQFMGAEEKELIDLQIKSNLLFFLRYRLVRLVRSLRK